MLTQRRFSTGPPGVTCVSHQECGKLCGNCEKLLSLCGFQLSPVSTKELFYVNKKRYFSRLENAPIYRKNGEVVCSILCQVETGKIFSHKLSTGI